MVLSARFAVPVIVIMLVAGVLLCASNLGISQPVSAADSQEVPVDWAHLPDGLEPGDSFRLLFVTSDTRDGKSSKIGDYNTFVQNAAARNYLFGSFSGQFRALASVAGTHAIDNSDTRGTGVPIYWVDGAKVANDYADFYDGSWASKAGTDEQGNLLTGRVDIWTGTNSDGTEHASELGSSFRVAMYTRLGIRSPFGNSIVTTGDKKHFYSLSPVLKVALGQAGSPGAAPAEDPTPDPARFPIPTPTPTPEPTPTPTPEPTPTPTPEPTPTPTPEPTPTPTPASSDSNDPAPTDEGTGTTPSSDLPSPDPRAPTITGTAQVGQTLYANFTVVDVTFWYQWLVDGVEIAGETNDTYVVRPGDVGKTITVRVDFTDDDGNTVSLTSTPTSEVVVGGL